MKAIALAAVALALLTTGCASAPQTRDEREAAWIASVNERFVSERDEDSASTSMSFGAGTVRIDIPSGTSSTWDEVEADLRSAIDALDQAPFDQFEIHITFSAHYWLWWDLINPGEIETAVAATEVWYGLRDSLADDAWVSGDTVRLELQSGGDPVAERNSIIEKLQLAGIDTEHSSILVLEN